MSDSAFTETVVDRNESKVLTALRNRAIQMGNNGNE